MSAQPYQLSFRRETNGAEIEGGDCSASPPKRSSAAAPKSAAVRALRKK